MLRNTAASYYIKLYSILKSQLSSIKLRVSIFMMQDISWVVTICYFLLTVWFTVLLVLWYCFRKYKEKNKVKKDVDESSKEDSD